MPYYIKKGNTYRVTPKENLIFEESLPPATYTVRVDPTGEFYLEKIDALTVSGKLYGNTTRDADRILRTFSDRPGATGVLLSGTKGSGKTLLAKLISQQARAEMKIPTIVVNNSWCGENFNTFLQTIDQPAVVLFDEFEKVYSEVVNQDKMLTLLDGVYPSKKLFLLTCNDKWRINSNMRNRPGRLFYALDFEGLDEDFVREYCQDNLSAKEHIEKVCAVSGLFIDFNFDMLQAIVEEMNRYDETPAEVLRFLNARPEFGDNAQYGVTLEVKGKKLSSTNGVMDHWHGNPVQNIIMINYIDQGEEGAGLCARSTSASFSAKDLERLDSRQGTYTFVNADGSRLVLKKIESDFNLNLDAFCSSPKSSLRRAARKSSASREQNSGVVANTPMAVERDY